MIDLLILIFTYLPNFLVHSFLIIGVLCFIISSLPLIIPNKIIIKYTSIFLIVLGIFLEGGKTVNDEYLERAKEWNHKIELAELKAEEINSQIQYIYLDRIQVVKDTQVIVRDRIRDIAVNVDEDCKINKDVIDILNFAGKNAGYSQVKSKSK